MMVKCKNRVIGAKNVPSWKNKCFQLGKLFFPTGNLKLGGYCKFLRFYLYNTIFLIENHQFLMVKSFDKNRIYYMIHPITRKNQQKHIKYGYSHNAALCICPIFDQSYTFPGLNHQFYDTFPRYFHANIDTFPRIHLANIDKIYLLCYNKKS